MWVLQTLKVCVFIALSSYFKPNGNVVLGATVPPNGMDSGFAVNSSTSDDLNECVCTVHVPSAIQCTHVSNPATTTRIEYLQEQISQLAATVSDHVALYTAQKERIDTVSETLFETLETLGRVEAGTLIVSRPEIVQIRQELTDLEAVLVTLRQNNASLAAISKIQAEVANVTILLDELEAQENADTSELLQTIEDLKSRLEECKNSEVTTALYDLWDQPGKQDTCSKLVSVSLPYTVSGVRATYGSWFRDPLVNKRHVFSFEMPNGRYGQTVKVYSSFRDFHENKELKSVSLTPNNAQGTGMVIYNGSLYYNIYSRGHLGRFNVTVNQQLVSVDVGAGYANVYSYRSATFSDIDLLVDEFGLWLVYSKSSANGFILLSTLDAETLDVMQTWQTTLPKNAAGNCFMVCGVLYCTNGFNSHINKINYMYDTKTQTERFLDIHFDNKYLATYSLNYNPYDQKLYGWDNGHQMIYDLVFESDEEEEAEN